MSEKREQILAEFREHFNEPVLLVNRLARVVGFGEDDHDYYLICDQFGGKRIWNTAVGGYTFLNRLAGQNEIVMTTGERCDDLIRLDGFLALNGAPRADEFIVKRYPAEPPHV